LILYKMAFQSPLSFNNPPQYFGVRVPNPVVHTNSLPALVTQRVNPISLGNVGTSVPISALLDSMVVVSPNGGSNSATGAPYTLPSAASLLSAFGAPLGQAKLNVGDCLIFRINNKGTSPAYIVSNSSGGDGSAVIAYANGNTGSYSGQGTGTVSHAGKVTQLTLEWLQVNSGSNGATGLYTVYC
jgi:hypothetical protein